MARYLSDAGYSVDEFGAGAQGEADLVVSDAQRAEKIAQSSRASGERPIVLCLSALGDPTGERLVAEGKSSATLSQPLLYGEILNVLRSIAAGEAPSLSAAKQSRTADEVPQFPGLRVLVADDSPVNREVVIEALARMAANVEVAENGVQAVEAVARQQYDIVLMDGSMPEMDGFEASKQIRAAEQASGAPRLPIVALTAHVVGTAADAWREAGMDGVLHKPFTIRALGDTLQRIFPAPFERRSSHAALSPTQRTEVASGLPSVQLPPAPASAAKELVAPLESEQPILDPQMLQQFEEMAAKGRSDFVSRVCNLYLSHAPQTREELAAALAAQDIESIGRSAHALKSMSFNIGAARLATIVGAMEHAARSEKTTPSEAQRVAFVTAFDETMEAVKKHLAASSGAERPLATATG
jgi:CheY-like chemotaxis protein